MNDRPLIVDSDQVDFVQGKSAIHELSRVMQTGSPRVLRALMGEVKWHSGSETLNSRTPTYGVIAIALEAYLLLKEKTPC